MTKQGCEIEQGGSLGTRPLSGCLVEGSVLESGRGRVWDVEQLVLER